MKTYVVFLAAAVILSSCGLVGAERTSNPGAGDSVRPDQRASAPTATVPVAADGFVDQQTAATLVSDCYIVGTVEEYFVIPDGSDYQTIFPNMGRSPEIAGESGLFVAMFDDGAEIENLMHQRTTFSPDGPTVQTSFDGVLCFVSPDGVPNVYANVSRAGMNLPPGAQQGPLPNVK